MVIIIEKSQDIFGYDHKRNFGLKPGNNLMVIKSLIKSLIKAFGDKTVI